METKQSLDARFVEALTCHRKAMYRLAHTMLRSSADAEDAVSAATLQAYRAVWRIRSWESIKPYLMRVTVNACHDLLRKRKREMALDVDTVLATQAAPEETPIWIYTQQLPLPMRTVLQLRYGEDLPIQDIAKILRVPRGTVASRINRAKQELKRRMKKEGY